MRLLQVETRFFKSFNFDYERRWTPGRNSEPWEDTADGWHPFVRVKIDPEITAVVGANEAGKSQLLESIEMALGHKDISAADFCRYSPLFSVQQGKVRSPEFAARLLLEEADLEVVHRLDDSLVAGGQLTLVRPGAERPFLLIAKSKERTAITAKQLEQLEGLLPKTHRLRTDLGMPDAMSIAELAGRPVGPLTSRSRRSRFLNSVVGGDFNDPTTLGALLFPLLSSQATDAERQRKEEFELGRRLLVEIARIEPDAFERLAVALEGEREGQIEGIVGAMNAAISQNLNFRRWWTQDQDFQIEVKAREHELALVIRDRTGASYSFNERSQGLRYFLSYFVQLAAHKPSTQDGREVLLLDEPDAFLSSQGQQDLLRVLQDYATPSDGSTHHQVVYVTHSPFLIDRNAGHRVRVLTKGSQDDGTRIVADASQNHYEPLRSSIGPAAAETAFIGGTNLIVEGLSDQIYLAGLSNFFRRTGSGHFLDLNDVTIVPAQSAGSVPYMVYLARGRGEHRPPCVALLDGDKQGKDAAAWLRRGLVRKKRILPDSCIVEVDLWAAKSKQKAHGGISIREIEDLIPLAMAVDAARAFARDIEGYGDEELQSLTVADLKARVKDVGELWDALQVAYHQAFDGAHIEKVGFARAVVEIVASGSASESDRRSIHESFSGLLRHLDETLRDARLNEDEDQNLRRVRGVVDSFLGDYPLGATKARVSVALAELGRALNDSPESDSIRAAVSAIERDFGLEVEPSSPVADYPALVDRMESLKLLESLRSMNLVTHSERDRAAED